MHEVALAGEILSTAFERSRLLGCPLPKAVCVSIGAWTCVNPGLLVRAFRAAADELGAAGIELRVRVVRPQCSCSDCGEAFEPPAFALRCAACGSARVVLEHGREIEIESIEV